MKSIIRDLLREGLFDEIPDETIIRAYKMKINELYDDLLINGERNRDFDFVLGKNVLYNPTGEPNKCETNAFNFIKEALVKGETKYFPVGGYMFNGQKFWPVEHWWVYDSSRNS